MIRQFIVSRSPRNRRKTTRRHFLAGGSACGILALAQTPPLPGTLEVAKISSGGWGRRYSRPKTAFWLGARIKELESDGEVSAVGWGDKNGVLVVEVPPGSCADKEVLRENDVLRGFNGQSVKNLWDLSAMRESQAQAGPITLELWRDQARRLLKISEK